MPSKRRQKNYAGMPIIEAKLRMLADAAKAAADAYRDDPVRKACKKAGVAQAVSSTFFNDVLDVLDEKMLNVDNIVHGWEVECITDFIERDPKKFQKFLKFDK